MRRQWTGVGTALVTPFGQSGSIDESAVRRLVARQIEGGVQFLVPCGTTGESPTLTRDEHLRVVALVVQEAARRVPVLAGAGGYNTHEVAELARACEAIGANGILSVTPYYNKPTQSGLIRHYETIAAATSLPIVLYNVPGRTGCNIEPKTVARLAAVPNIVAVKEASGNMTQICEVCRLVPDDFIVLSGDDAMTLPAMAIGAQGIISVVSNVSPDGMVSMVQAAERGDFESARKAHQRLLPLMLVSFVESNPIPVKAAMAMMGLLEEVYRLPMVPPSDASRARISEVLNALEMVAAREPQ
jgi:4-hydroxy-tetrahydrodipicolinate synthase